MKRDSPAVRKIKNEKGKFNENQKNHNIDFDCSIKLEKFIFVLGDVDSDGKISVTDARPALRQAVGLESFDELQFRAAKVNGSTNVSVNDARSFLRAAVGLKPGNDRLVKIK